MLLCELQDLTAAEIANLRKQMLKNLRDFCKSTFDKPVDISAKGDHLYAKHHENEQIEFDLWIHGDYVYLDNFYIDESLKNHGIGTKFVDTMVATLPEQLMIKVRDHTGPETQMISMSDTFWSKMKAKHDGHRWIITH